MENYEDININEMVQAVLNNECTSTLPAAPKLVKSFVPEEEDAFRVIDAIRFGITKPTFCNVCITGA
jgi:hypothetical protein